LNNYNNNNNNKIIVIISNSQLLWPHILLHRQYCRYYYNIYVLISSCLFFVLIINTCYSTQSDTNDYHLDINIIIEQCASHFLSKRIIIILLNRVSLICRKPNNIKNSPRYFKFNYYTQRDLVIFNLENVTQVSSI